MAGRACFHFLELRGALLSDSVPVPVPSSSGCEGATLARRCSGDSKCSSDVIKTIQDVLTLEMSPNTLTLMNAI